MLLEALGAQDINVKCRGGLPDFDINWINAEYSVLLTAEADKATTVGQVLSRNIRIKESCDLNDRMMRKFLSEFEVYAQDRRGVCNDSRGRLNYDVLLLSQ